MPEAFIKWQEFSQTVRRFPVGMIINGGTTTNLSDEIIAAYEAPFPDESYKAGPRIFPSLVPTTPGDPAASANRKAWKSLIRFDKPFLTAFSDGDPITSGGDLPFQRLIRGAKGQPHTTITAAGHFLQRQKAGWPRFMSLTSSHQPEQEAALRKVPGSCCSILRTLTIHQLIIYLSLCPIPEPSPLSSVLLSERPSRGEQS